MVFLLRPLRGLFVLSSIFVVLFSVLPVFGESESNPASEQASNYCADRISEALRLSSHQYKTEVAEAKAALKRAHQRYLDALRVLVIANQAFRRVDDEMMARLDTVPIGHQKLKHFYLSVGLTRDQLDSLSRMIDEDLSNYLGSSKAAELRQSWEQAATSDDDLNALSYFLWPESSIFTHGRRYLFRPISIKDYDPLGGLRAIANGRMKATVATRVFRLPTPRTNQDP